MSNPVGDFKRFEELVNIVANGTEAERMAALDELAEDLADTEVLARLVEKYVTSGEAREIYDSVWKD